MSLFLASLGFGLVTAAVLAIAAVGFTMQFAVTDVLNLAYGAVMIGVGVRRLLRSTRPGSTYGSACWSRPRPERSRRSCSTAGYTRRSSAAAALLSRW